jgi:Leucine-rich repeat (LRR) protein
LIIPNSLQNLSCSNNRITDLIIPNSLQYLKYLSCHHNNLLFFELHEYNKLNKFIKFYKKNIILKKISYACL